MVRQWRLISIVNLFGHNVNVLLLYAHTPGPGRKQPKLLSTHDINHIPTDWPSDFVRFYKNNLHRENEMHAICAHNFIYGFNTIERVAKRCIIHQKKK